HAWLGEIDEDNPDSITWTQLPDYPGGTVGRHAAGVTTLNDGKVYFTSGNPDGAGTSATGLTYAYNVVNGQWEGGPAKPEAVGNVANFVPFVQNDSAYRGVLGSYTGSVFVRTFESINLGEYINNGGDIIASESIACEGTSITLTADGNHDVTWSPEELFGDVNESNPVIAPE